MFPAAPESQTHRRCLTRLPSRELNQDWISDEVDIRQLMIETHRLGPGNPADMFDDIQHAGFAMFSKEPNIFPMVGGRCVEWSFVKLHRDFFRQQEGTLESNER
jgi:Methyltransferase domain